MFKVAAILIFTLFTTDGYPSRELKRRQVNFGSFDPNALYQQVSQQMQQYLDSHKTDMPSDLSLGSGSSYSSGSGSSNSGSGSSQASSGTSGGGSFDPNVLYQQQLQQAVQSLSSFQQNMGSKYDANLVNSLQSKFTDPSSSQLGSSNGAGAGFDPDKYNNMKFNFLNSNQGGQFSSQSASGQMSG